LSEPDIAIRWNPRSWSEVRFMQLQLQLCAAGLVGLCLIGCSRSMRTAVGASVSDAAASDARDAMPDDATADASDATDAASPGSPDGAPAKSNDAGSSLREDAAARDAGEHAGAADPPPTAADASAPSPFDPFSTEPEPVGPHIAIDFPPSDARTDRAELQVRGRLVAAKGGTLTLNGASVSVDDAGAWTTKVQLAPGKNALQLELALGDQRFHATRNVRSCSQSTSRAEIAALRTGRRASEEASEPVLRSGKAGARSRSTLRPIESWWRARTSASPESISSPVRRSR
jgi:hypothetical protein